MPSWASPRTVTALWASAAPMASTGPGTSLAPAATEDIPAVYADSSTGTGVQAYGEFGGTPSITTPAGGSFLGLNGVYGQTDTGFGSGVYARSNGGLNFALFAQGNAHVTGNFSVDGTCTGCTAAAVAINGS